MAELKYLAQDINRILGGSVQNCAWTNNALYFETEEGNFAAPIPNATNTGAGLMSAQSYTMLYNLQSRMNSLATIARSATIVQSANDATIAFLSGTSGTGVRLYEAVIPSATSTAAGLMTPAEKEKIESIETQQIGVASWTSNGRDAHKLIVKDEGIKTTDTAVLYRYARRTLGANQSRNEGKATGRIHASGWVKVNLPCAIRQDRTGRKIITPVGYDTFVEYSEENPSISIKYDCGINLNKKCAIVVYRNDEPITGFIRFRVKHDKETGEYSMSRW